MDFNPYAAQVNAGINPYLMQHQMQMPPTGYPQQMQQGYGYPSAGIDYPGMNDVMCGRGGGTNNHIGNIRFRQLVNEHKIRYLKASKVDKPKVAMEVVVMWRGLDPPGRFLTKTDANQGDDSLWHDVGDKKAREKASQCLRERTPDVMPFVKQLQELKKEEEDKRQKETEKSVDGATPVMESAADPRADNVVSGDTPDAALSRGTAIEDTKVADKYPKLLRTREDIESSVPTANTFEDVFDDDDFDDEFDEDGLTLEAYQSQMQEFLETAAKGDASDEYSVGDRSLLMMETLSTTSWVKSFQSISSQGGGAMMMSLASMRETEETDELPAQEIEPEKSTRGQKVAAMGMQNSISMLSDMTDFKSTRSAKMGASRAPSNFSISMMSELTDLSEGMKNMDVHGQQHL